MSSDRDPNWRLRGFARTMRHEPTDVEKLIWTKLRDRQLIGMKFRWQVPINGFILDFYCMEKKLAIELDGGQHVDPDGKRRDADRERVLADRGIRVLRFSNVDVLKDVDVVLTAIVAAIEEEPSP